MGPLIKQVPVYFGGSVSLWLTSASCYCKFSIDLHLLLTNMPPSVMLPDNLGCHLLCIQLHLCQPGSPISSVKHWISSNWTLYSVFSLYLLVFQLNLEAEYFVTWLRTGRGNWSHWGWRLPLCGSSGWPFALLLPICSHFLGFLTTQPFSLPSPKNNSTYDKTIASSHTVHLAVIT